MTEFRIRRLAELVEGWRQTTVVRALAERLEDELSGGREAFREAPLPEALVGDRLPPGIECAFLLVLRPKGKTEPHKHPNSVQHFAVLSGTGTVMVGRRTDVAQPFDPALPQRSIYVIRENIPHAFEAYNEPMVVLSFQTVKSEDLRELRAATARREDEGGPRRTGPREKAGRPQDRPRGTQGRPGRPQDGSKRPQGGGRRDKPGPRGDRGRGGKPGPRSGGRRPR